MIQSFGDYDHDHCGFFFLLFPCYCVNLKHHDGILGARTRPPRSNRHFRRHHSLTAVSSVQPSSSPARHKKKIWRLWRRTSFLSNHWCWEVWPTWEPQTCQPPFSRRHLAIHRSRIGPSGPRWPDERFPVPRKGGSKRASGFPSAMVPC